MSDFVIENGVLVRYTGSGGNVIVPEGVTEIGDNAFWYCRALTSIALPKGLTNIGHRTFNGCIRLTSITLPDGLTVIGEKAFSGCSGLTSITLPEGLTEIHWNAFRGCSGLTTITLPNSITIIAAGAFDNCSELTSIKLPESVKYIGKLAFMRCRKLATIILSSTNDTPVLSPELLQELIVPIYSSLKSIHVTDVLHAAELIRATIDDERLFGLLAVGALERSAEAPELLRMPELLREPVFGKLIGYAQEHDMAEAVALLLQAQHEVFPGEEDDELEL